MIFNDECFIRGIFKFNSTLTTDFTHRTATSQMVKVKETVGFIQLNDLRSYKRLYTMLRAEIKRYKWVMHLANPDTVNEINRQFITDYLINTRIRAYTHSMTAL